MTRPGVPDDVVLLDVRRDDEWAAGHAPDAIHIPLDQLEARLPDLRRDQPIVAVCHSGARSGRATAYLRQQGYDATNYEGGMLAWARAGGAVVSENGQSPSVG